MPSMCRLWSPLADACASKYLLAILLALLLNCYVAWLRRLLSLSFNRADACGYIYWPSRLPWGWHLYVATPPAAFRGDFVTRELGH